MSNPVVVPVSPTANQTAAYTLGDQAVQISLRQNGANLYLDLLLADQTPIVLGRVCRNMNNLLADAGYQPFTGILYFVDLQGDTQPNYAGLGSRYLLLYWDALA